MYRHGRKLKNTELQTLNRWILSYVNFISKKPKNKDTGDMTGFKFELVEVKTMISEIILKNTLDVINGRKHCRRK